MPTPIAQAGPQPKNIVIFKHSDINVKFPKMGIWVVSDLGNIEVVSISGTEITPLNKKPVTILSVKDKWDFKFNPPYVFTGPFGTVDSAIDWAKSHPNQAAYEKMKSMKPASVGAAVAEAAQKAAPAQSAAPSKSAAELKEEVFSNIAEKIPAIKKSQAETLALFDKSIAACAGVKCEALKLLKCAFEAEIKAMDANVEALKCAVSAYSVAQPNAPIGDSVNGYTIDKILKNCIECNAGALELMDKTVKKG